MLPLALAFAGLFFCALARRYVLIVTGARMLAF